VRFSVSRSLMALALFAVGGAAAAQADPPGDPTAVKQDGQGYWRDKNDDPTYKIEKDGTVDYATFNGYRRFNSTCYVCHGLDGSGSSFAPALANSLKTMDYATFAGTVVNGRKNLINGNENVMPSFADNKNVTCYLNDIYVYLRARSTGALGRGRPAKHGPKPAGFSAAEDKCMADD
jgi:methanol metabolism-related c-type cytochrome